VSLRLWPALHRGLLDGWLAPLLRCFAVDVDQAVCLLVAFCAVPGCDCLAAHRIASN
jgi:hypothetical protein